MFATLSDRLAETFKNLRGKGRLSEADIDATAREIRIALLEADVALPVVKDFVAAVKERARGEEVSQALNPAQQIVKIVNEELVEILGGETRRLRFAKTPPTVIMLAGRAQPRPSSAAARREAPEPVVLVHHGASDAATVLEVRGADRPGVVHDVCAALAGLGLSIRSAHVTTVGPQAVDVFYVVEPGAGALRDDRAAEALHAVRAALSPTVTLGH